ncbi:MAG: glycoside hydrolase family 3 C-terminal domain-containing protein [Oscillospiraceae bacterium]|nr:glycoside hydrolase family 3 C-terminal domain-containing protein [Oscillospiraceae bacterium]
MTKWRRIRFLPSMPLGEDGKRVTACPEHIALSKNAAKEGMVLLKNTNGLLPFAKGTKLALFGMGTLDYVKGGGGSGGVNVAYDVNLYEGFRKLDGHVEICEEVMDYYRNYAEEISDTHYWPGQKPEPELPEELCLRARAYTDTAVITISRLCGEGWDRDVKGHHMYEEGDFYLSHAERAMVEKVKAHFPKIVVVLNVGGVVDTQWFCNDDRVQAALMAWQGGIEGGTAAAELLCGVGTPSGKLTDTFAKHLEDYPATAAFHESQDYVDYTEDIYVGYRYFETIPGAAEKVNYPFGFGLSYTRFSWNVLSAGQVEGNICVQVDVKNIGCCAGKEVIQLYVSAPQGKLGKASRSLVAFQKTKLLQPGENEVMTLEFAIDSMASYDDLGKIKKSAYVLEKGEYCFYAGTSVRDTVKLSYVYSVEEDTVTQQLTPKLTPKQLKRRLLADGTYEALPVCEPAPEENGLTPQTIAELEATLPVIRGVSQWPKRAVENRDYYFFDEVAEGKVSLDAFVKQLTDEQLVYMVNGQPNMGVANTYGIGNIPEYGVPNAMTSDGPAGVRILKECQVYTTAFPCSTQLACSWNRELAYAVGEAGAKELKENNLAVWLTPAINIHRNPQCGRNFEYYSEDPLIGGILAGEFIRGVQSQKVSACLKHFAFNNKETNRKNSDSRVSERAAREIYLKGFEMIVKNVDPWYIMSAYNKVNGCRTSECRELLVDILREEWGFDGMVSSDWLTYSEQYKELNAGNDLRMPAGFPERLKEALEKGLITRQQLEINAKNILGLLLKLE